MKRLIVILALALGIVGAASGSNGGGGGDGGYPPNYCRQAIDQSVTFIAPYLRQCSYGISYTYPDWGVYSTTFGNIEGCQPPQPKTGPCWRWRHEGYPW